MTPWEEPDDDHDGFADSTGEADRASLSLFEGDQGALTLEQRKALVAVIKNR